MKNLKWKAWMIGVATVIVTAGACSGQPPQKKSGAVVDHSTMTAAQHAAMHSSNDSAYAAMQKRGGMAMGVDQYNSTHKFDTTPNGGRIELQANKYDALTVAQIRAHLRLIQHAFQAGDFRTPAFVHLRNMPGTNVMARKKAVIQYAYGELPRGGEVRMTTSDSEARDAIAAFMTAQRKDHRAGGMK